MQKSTTNPSAGLDRGKRVASRQEHPTNSRPRPHTKVFKWVPNRWGVLSPTGQWSAASSMSTGKSVKTAFISSSTPTAHETRQTLRSSFLRACVPKTATAKKSSRSVAGRETPRTNAKKSWITTSTPRMSEGH
ncbi:hypothetical protein BDR05DRAFT_451438 [Suillus weaverae]|nr:hypothetical protein BDR05DRAFT_451438 [Suillus weaverae]